LNGDRNIKDIVEHSKFWKALADEKNCANSNYGYLTLYERCHNVNGKLLSPAEWCMHTLKKDINSRQAVMLYNKPQYVTDTNDFICTQTQQFICRGNTLHNIVNIRSSDAIRGLSFDIPWWRFIGNVIANSLGKVPGYMVVNIGSSHIYEPHFMLVNNMCCEDWVKYSLKTTLTLDKIYCHGKWNAADIEKALIIESYEDSDIRGDDSE
jgi:thymidylate synthase